MLRSIGHSHGCSLEKHVQETIENPGYQLELVAPLSRVQGFGYLGSQKGIYQRTYGGFPKSEENPNIEPQTLQSFFISGSPHKASKY